MKKRFVSLILCLGVCLSLMTTTAFAAGFSDVKSTAYYAKPVEWATSKGITGGTSATTFSPDNTCSRAHILTFLWRAAGSPASKAFLMNPYLDISEDAYYYQAALWAKECGMVQGSYFAPGTLCTRLAALEYIWRYAGAPAAEKVSHFTDLPSDKTASTAISWGVRYGVTGGTSATTFTPNKTCTRAQIVTFLYRYFVEPGEYKEPENAKPAETDNMKLDPLPPQDYLKHPDWYGTLTPAHTMSDERLKAEYDQMEALIDDYRARDEYVTLPMLVRRDDLMYECMKRRIDV